MSKTEEKMTFNASRDRIEELETEVDLEKKEKEILQKENSELRSKNYELEAAVVRLAIELANAKR